VSSAFSHVLKFFKDNPVSIQMPLATIERAVTI